MPIRPTTAQDIPAILAAEQDVAAHHEGRLISLPDELHEAAFHERLDLTQWGLGYCLVVEQGGHIVAHASLWSMGLRRIQHVLRLDMCVHPGHWRQGHGERLLRALIAWANAQPQHRKIELLVRSENASAIRLYARFAFVVEGVFRDRVRLG